MSESLYEAVGHHVDRFVVMIDIPEYDFASVSPEPVVQYPLAFRIIPDTS